ncbi:MAG: imelysin family protein [Verrucomicrobiota bacterium]|nr:imelysin family protein [Verrucomicrobiota bacterium]
MRRIILTLFLSLLLTSHGGEFSKPAMLEDLWSGVLVPSFADFHKQAQELKSATENFKANPTQDTLLAARKAWKSALLKWKLTTVAHFGPALESGLLNRIYYWPSRRNSIDKVLRDTAELTPEYLANLGVTAVSMGALEYLLFHATRDDAALLSTFEGEAGARRRAYVSAVASEIERDSRELLAAVSSEKAKTTFVNGGQESLTAIVNLIAATVEGQTVIRLRQGIQFSASKLTSPDFFEGGNSGTSVELITAALMGAKAYFTGAPSRLGLKDNLKQVGSPIQTSLLAQFDAAIAALEAIQMPLADALKNKKELVEKAHDECKKLEIMLKADLTSALGVALTFTSVDGD